MLKISENNGTEQIGLVTPTPEPFTYVYATDTDYCTVPTSPSPRHETLLRVARDALLDRNLTACMPLFAEGRNLFQTSVDYPTTTRESLDVWFSGTGILCKKCVTIYFEKHTDDCWLSGKRQCVFLGQSINALKTNTDCTFRCHILVPRENEVRVTIKMVSPR